MNEYETEPVRGLPEYLPAGEQMVWQGAPSWRELARRLFHVRKVAVYFLVLIAVLVGTRLADGTPAADAAKATLWLMLLGAGAVGLLSLLAWLYARTTVYTVTDKRLVMRFGVALPMMINLPWERIDSVDLKQYANGGGDIILTLAKDKKIPYWLLWPHARPWRVAHAQPMLRGLPDAESAARSLARALQAEGPSKSVATRIGQPRPAASAAVAHGARTAAAS